MKMLLSLLALLAMSMSLSGCLLGAAAGAGAVTADEINERDGKFDPLEKTYDGDDDTNALGIGEDKDD